MTTWLVVVGAALCTYLLRISMVVAFAGRGLPAAFEARLRLVGPAALAAILGGALFVAHGSAHAAPPAHVLAVVAGALTVRRTGNAVHALAVGLPVAWAAAAAGLG